MITSQAIIELKKYSSKKRKETNEWFFKTGKGEYGEGDKFIGVSMPDTRKVAKQFVDLSLNEVQKLLKDKIHEVRMLALLILTYKYAKADEDDKKKIFDFYLKNTKYINNWDLVDVSCYQIVGDYLLDKDRKVLYKLASSKYLWEERISVVSCYAFINTKIRDFHQDRFKDILKISEKLLNHEHDLMHKAIGWMLREVGKKDEKVLKKFLKKHYKKMPRTMLRYSIEKFPESTRQKYLKGKI